MDLSIKSPSKYRIAQKNKRLMDFEISQKRKIDAINKNLDKSAKNKLK